MHVLRTISRRWLHLMNIKLHKCQIIHTIILLVEICPTSPPYNYFNYWCVCLRSGVDIAYPMEIITHQIESICLNFNASFTPNVSCNILERLSKFISFKINNQTFTFENLCLWYRKLNLEVPVMKWLSS